MSVLPAAAAPAEIDSREWAHSLRAPGPTGEEAVTQLHALLVRAARFEISRRRRSVPQIGGSELDEIALDAAGDALVSVLRRLDDFRGDSRLSTWVYKFAILEAAAKLRKRAWQGRELPVEPHAWSHFAGADLEPDAYAEQRELLSALHAGILDTLTPHQRRVLVALALNGVPIDVLAERLETTRGALYKTLHDARRALRRHLSQRGLTIA